MIFRLTCGRLSGCCAQDPADSLPSVDVHQSLTITLLEVECRRNYLDKLKVMTDQEVLQCEMNHLSEDVLKIEKRLGDFESKIQLVIDVATGSRRSLTRGSPSDGSSEEEVGNFTFVITIFDNLTKFIFLSISRTNFYFYTANSIQPYTVG